MLDIFVSDKSSAKFFSKIGKLTASILDDWEDDWGIDTGFVGVFSLLLLKLHSQLPWHVKHFLRIFMNCQNMHFIQIIMHMVWVKNLLNMFS